MRRLRRHRRAPMLPVVLLAASLALAACRTTPPVPPAAEDPFAPEVARYRDAARGSERLRAELERLSRGARPSVARFGELKREYFALRATFFELGMLNASAIVEREDGGDARGRLLRVSLALVAGTDLVRNFHEVGAALATWGRSGGRSARTRSRRTTWP